MLLFLPSAGITSLRQQACLFSVNNGSRDETPVLGLARQAHSGLSFLSSPAVTILKILVIFELEPYNFVLQGLPQIMLESHEETLHLMHYSNDVVFPLL